jgi:hypothetical protein
MEERATLLSGRRNGRSQAPRKSYSGICDGRAYTGMKVRWGYIGRFRLIVS